MHKDLFYFQTPDLILYSMYKSRKQKALPPS